MPSILFPTLDEVKTLHDILIDRYGGSAGLRDEGLLSSVLYRPQSGYYENIFEMAAALLQSLAMNHVFVDGNKRVAFATADIFLRMNGFDLNASIDEAEDFVVNRLIKKSAEIREIAQWLEKSAAPLK